MVHDLNRPALGLNKRENLRDLVERQSDRTPVRTGGDLALLRLESVKAQTGLSRSAIYRLIAERKFPRPFHVAGTRTVVWPSDHVEAWVRQQIADASA